MAWGVWRIAESELGALGEVRGRDLLEAGCGGAQWSVALSLAGGRPVGLDNSREQLAHARRNMKAAGVDFPLVHASVDRIPLADERFDVIFADHGALSFADPRSSIPECARLLRPGGVLAFCMSTPLRDLAWSGATQQVDSRMHHSYFGLGRWEDEDAHVEYQLPYGEWIRLFGSCGLIVEDLIELRPPSRAHTTYPDFVPLRWARRWPAEHIWKVRKGRSGDAG
jgi:SAM-dependent methyltransferase